MTGEAPAPAEQNRTPAEFARELHGRLSEKLAAVEFKPPSYATTISYNERPLAIVSDDNSYMLSKRSLRTTPEQRLEDIRGGNAILSLMDTNPTNESNRFLILKPHTVDMSSALGSYLSARPEILQATAPEDYAVLQLEVGQVTEPYPPFINDVATALGIPRQ